MSDKKKTLKSASLSPEETQNIQWKKFLWLSWILTFLLMTILSLWFGISGDELDMNSYGKAILNYFTTFGADKTALSTADSGFDRDGVLQYYGGFFDLVAALVNKISPLEEFTTRHILNAWTGFLALFFASKLAVRIKGYRMAVLTVWLMFFAPFFFGHAMNNPKDIPLAAAYIAGIYYFIAFVQKFPKVTWKDYIAPIIALGLTIDIRVAGILLIPYMFVWLFGNYLFYKEERAAQKELLLPVIIISVAGYLFASLLWPYALQNPIMNPITALQEVSHFKMGLMQVYNGERIISYDLPKSYLVHNFFITNPYILILGFLAGLFFFIGSFKEKEFTLMGFVLFVTIFPVAYIIYTGANVYHAWRHVLFIFPSAAIAAAYGLERLLLWADKGAMKYAVIGLLGLGFLEPATFFVRAFPNTNCYFNAFAGGVKDAYYNHEMDYYYNSLKETCDWFIEHEIPKMNLQDTVVVASNHTGIVSTYLKDYPTIKVRYVRFYQRSVSDWDYGIFHRALIPADQLQSGGWMIEKMLKKTSIYDLPLSIAVQRPSKLDFTGFNKLNEQQNAAGIADLLQYQKIDAKNELVNGLLARYYLSINNKDSARYYAIKTLEVSPESAEGKQVLSALNQR